MRIGELAAQAGVTAKTIRFYEGRGLLAAPERRANGYRDYGSDAVERLRFIRDSQAAGLTLAETGEILRMKDEGTGTCHHTQALLDKHLADIDKQIDSLLAARALARRAALLDPDECTDPNRCQVLSVDLPVHSNV